MIASNKMVVSNEMIAGNATIERKINIVSDEMQY